MVNRRLTTNEKKELGGTKLVKSRKNTLDVKLEDFEHQLVIGRGHFGKVILSKMKLTGKEYAIKILRKDRLLDEDQIEHTRLEKDVLLELDHPFLVGMEYLFMDDLRLYFVMPFVRGAELFSVKERKTRFNLDEIRFYAAQATLALGYLHEHQIAHRDLKLENVLVDEHGYLKLIDFGLAKKFTPGTIAKTVCGTPEYIAPEIYLGQA